MGTGEGDKPVCVSMWEQGRLITAFPTADPLSPAYITLVILHSRRSVCQCVCKFVRADGGFVCLFTGTGECVNNPSEQKEQD